MHPLDRIELTGLTAFGRHGVFDFEREQGQDFTVDLRLSLDTARAAETDDVADTVHYGELAEKVVAIVEGEPVNLIETLARRISDAVLEDDRVRSVAVTVHKPHAPIRAQFADVSVTVHGVRDAHQGPGQGGARDAEQGEAREPDQAVGPGGGEVVDQDADPGTGQVSGHVTGHGAAAIRGDRP